MTCTIYNTYCNTKKHRKYRLRTKICINSGSENARMTRETHIEESLIGKLTDLKYTYRDNIRDRNDLERNFREKFESLNRVKLTDLLESLELNWKERRKKELALMEDHVLQLKKLAQGREISGLAAYE